MDISIGFEIGKRKIIFSEENAKFFIKSYRYTIREDKKQVIVSFYEDVCWDKLDCDNKLEIELSDNGYNGDNDYNSDLTDFTKLYGHICYSNSVWKMLEEAKIFIKSNKYMYYWDNTKSSFISLNIIVDSDNNIISNNTITQDRTIHFFEMINNLARCGRVYGPINLTCIKV